MKKFFIAAALAALFLTAAVVVMDQAAKPQGAVAVAGESSFGEYNPDDQVANAIVASLTGKFSEKADIPSAIVCTAKDEMCSNPVSLEKARVVMIERLFDGPHLCVEGTPKWEAALDVMATPDGEHSKSWSVIYAD